MQFTKQDEKTLLEAYMVAVEAFGPDIKGLSCFLPNWGNHLANVTNSLVKAAA
jgi:hypothetical protein